MEYTDELIGRIVGAAARDAVIALVSDQGFERVDKVLNVPALLAGARGGIAITKDDAVAAVVAKVGRRIPNEEVERYARQFAASMVFEPAEDVEFGNGKDDLEGRDGGTTGRFS